MINIACRCGQNRMDYGAYWKMSAHARANFRAEIETCRGCDKLEREAASTIEGASQP